MPLRRSTVMALAGAALLGACGKPATVSDQPATADASASTQAVAAPTVSAPATAAAKAALATLPAVYQSADLDNGQVKFAACKSCHTLAKGGEAMVGPNLYGVFGRKAGSVAGFSYSDGLKASGIVWDAAEIDKWITNPHALIAGTKMSYLGMQSAKDRVDVVAYLKVATSPPGR